MEILASIVMPDHVHLLFELGAHLRLGQALAKFKTFARDRGFARWRWQEESFEHRLRAHESAESYAFYIFMNPYRANLLTLRERWPWWYCPHPKLLMFLSGIGDEALPREWIGEVEHIATRLAVHS